MNSRTLKIGSAIAVAGVLVLGGAGMASAADSSSRTATTKTSHDAAGSAASKNREHRATESTLTAAQKDKAGAAAVAAVPGTVHHVRAARDGGYLVIVTKDDGTKTAVTLNKDYKVTGTATAKDRAAKTGNADSGKSRSGTHGHTSRSAA